MELTRAPSKEAVVSVGGPNWVCNHPPQKAEDETNRESEREKDGHPKRWVDSREGLT